MKRGFIVYVLFLSLLFALTSVIDVDLKIFRGPGSSFLKSILISAVTYVFLLGLGYAIQKYGFKNIVFALTPFILFIFVIEVSTRYWFNNLATEQQKNLFYSPAVGDLGQHSVYIPHHYTLYHTRPNLERQGKKIHNALGFRDEKDDYHPEEFNIIFIGGSTTYTIGIEDNNLIFTEKLQRQLNEHLQSQHLGPVNVINAGMGAATSGENLARLTYYVSQTYPDLIVIQHGLNDYFPLKRYGCVESDYSNYRQRWTVPSFYDKDPLNAATIATLASKSIIGGFIMRVLTRRHPYPVTQFTINQSQENAPCPHDYGLSVFLRNTRFMVALAKEMGADVMLSSNAIIKKGGRGMFVHNQINPALLKLASELAVSSYDFGNAMPSDVEHLPDGRHVSQKGSDVKADLYFERLTRRGYLVSLLKK